MGSGLAAISKVYHKQDRRPDVARFAFPDQNDWFCKHHFSTRTKTGDNLDPGLLQDHLREAKGDLKEERIRMRVHTAEGREVIVYAAPVSCEDQQALGLRSGKVIEVTGSPAKYGTQTVLVAGSIVVDGKTARLRDDQGRVTWTKK